MGNNGHVAQKTELKGVAEGGREYIISATNMSEAYLARLYKCIFSTHLVGRLGLLGQVVHGADEVEDLHHVHPRDAEPAPTARHVVRLVQPVAVERAREDLRRCKYREIFCFRFHLGCAAHEVVEEVVGELDQVHDCFGTLQDLPVQGRLDVRLQILQT